jgi:hypothetical protein
LAFVTATFFINPELISLLHAFYSQTKILFLPLQPKRASLSELYLPIFLLLSCSSSLASALSRSCQVFSFLFIELASTKVKTGLIILALSEAFTINENISPTRFVSHIFLNRLINV